MIRLLVDRLWVWSKDRRVIREIWDALTPAARRDPARRETRRAYYREALEIHHENQRLVREFNL